MKSKKSIKKPNLFFFNILLFLFILLLPTQFGKFFFFPFSYISGLRIDYLAYAIYATDILAIIIITLRFKDILIFFKNKIVLSIFFFLGISIFFSFSPPIAFYKFLKLLEFIALFIVFKNIKFNKNILLYSLLLGTITQLFLSISHLINQRSVQGIFYYLGERYFTSAVPGIAKASLNGVEIMRPYGSFSHPNSMAGFYLLIYAFVLGIDFKKNQILKNIILVMCIFLILISFSKAAIFSLIIVNIIYLIKTLKKSLCKFCSVSRVIVLFLLSLIFLYAKTDPLSVFKRLELIKNSISLILKYPITGVGIGNYLIAQDKLVGVSNIFPPQPVHNIIFLLVAEVGIFLGIAILLFIVKYFYPFRKYDSFILCFFVILITGFFDHYWMTLQQNILVLAVVFGFITNPQVVSEKSR